MTNARKSFYFQRETQKYQLNSDIMLRHRRVDAPQPAEAAAPRTRCRAVVVPMHHSPPQPAAARHIPQQPLRLVHDADPPTRQCATARRSRCARDCACCVPACLPLIRSCHRTQRDLQRLLVRHRGPFCVPLCRMQPLRC